MYNLRIPVETVKAMLVHTKHLGVGTGLGFTGTYRKVYLQIPLVWPSRKKFSNVCAWVFLQPRAHGIGEFWTFLWVVISLVDPSYPVVGNAAFFAYF